jgi:hypothetical protein
VLLYNFHLTIIIDLGSREWSAKDSKQSGARTARILAIFQLGGVETLFMFINSICIISDRRLPSCNAFCWHGETSRMQIVSVSSSSSSSNRIENAPVDRAGDDASFAPIKGIA